MFFSCEISDKQPVLGKLAPWNQIFLPRDEVPPGVLNWVLSSHCIVEVSNDMYVYSTVNWDFKFFEVLLPCSIFYTD
jgi:hypothetical protein